MAKSREKAEAKSSPKDKAIRRFRKDANALATLVNEQLFEGGRNFYWIGDEVGGLCDFDGVDFLSPTEMVLILEQGITYEQYAEWRDASLDYNADKEVYQHHYINLHSWLLGARYEMFDDNEKPSEVRPKDTEEK